MNLQELRALLAQLDTQMRGIMAGADKEKGLSADEATRFDDLEKQFDTVQDQVARLERAEKRSKYMDEATSVAVVPSNDGGNERSEDDYQSAFWKAVRGEALEPMETRALATNVDNKGGYLVPESFADTIIKKVAEKSVMRKLATVSSSTSLESLPVEGDDGENGWIDEEGTYPESDPTISQVQLNAYKTGRIIKVTDEALDDTVPAVEGYIALKFSKSTTKAEEKAFVTGDGIKKPTGVLVTAEVGKTAALADAITGDEIIDLEFSVDEDYAVGGCFMMNRNTLKAIRKLKDSNGQYLWVQGFSGTPDTFNNKPIVINKHMPDIAAGAKPIAFGDFSYYFIKDRKVMSMKRLDEKYADTGHVGFRIDKRVDGKLVLPEAVKTLEMAAS